MTTEQNKAIVRRFFEAFAANDEGALKEVLAPDLVAYSHGAPGPQSREAHLQTIGSWNAAFGETHFTIEEQLAEGDKVATRVTMRSVHNRGDFQGVPPTGKQVAVSGISLERINDGKIVERRVSGDWLGMMQQLGLIPPPQANR
jgi:predicted ester cyclase